MKISYNKFIFIPIVIITLNACHKDPHIHNEEELITSVIYNLTPVGGGNEIVMTFKDPDGDGGIPPTITGGILAQNTSYNARITLLNESVSPVIDITDEVENEGTSHQFFFTTTIPGLTINYADLDKNGKPLGILSTINTTSGGQGFIKIVLRHNPDKNASGVALGVITNAGGETDIEVSFPVSVQ